MVCAATCCAIDAQAIATDRGNIRRLVMSLEVLVQGFLQGEFKRDFPNERKDLQAFGSNRLSYAMLLYRKSIFDELIILIIVSH